MKNAFRLGAILLTSCACGLLSAAEITGANAEVVVAPDAPPATRFAAAEMTNYLSRVLGRAFLLDTAPTKPLRGMSMSSTYTARDADAVGDYVNCDNRHLPEAGYGRTYQTSHFMSSSLDFDIFPCQKV